MNGTQPVVLIGDGDAAGDGELRGARRSLDAVDGGRRGIDLGRPGSPAGDGGGAVAVVLPQPASRHATVSAIEASFLSMARTSIS